MGDSAYAGMTWGWGIGETGRNAPRLLRRGGVLRYLPRGVDEQDVRPYKREQFPFLASNADVGEGGRGEGGYACGGSGGGQSARGVVLVRRRAGVRIQERFD